MSALDSMLEIVTGQACLDYINRPIGLIAEDFANRTNYQFYNQDMGNCSIYAEQHSLKMHGRVNTFGLNAHKLSHNTNKRKVGLVLNRYEDGGIHIALLGDETFSYKNYQGYAHKISIGVNVEYEQLTPTIECQQKPGYLYAPGTTVADEYVNNGCFGNVNLSAAGVNMVSFDELLDYTPTFSQNTSIPNNDLLKHGDSITNDINDTLHYGEGYVGTCHMWGVMRDNPIRLLAGDIYTAFMIVCNDMHALCPIHFDKIEYFHNFSVPMADTLDSFNQCAIPFNVILTESEMYARNYLEHGTLPPDAFLYPLDWDNLPRFDQTIPTGDEPDDYPDDNTPDDITRDFEPTPNEIVSFTVNQLTNYNWYWLTVPEWSAFISWFWNDIGNYSDFDDIIAKVKGLYNDVASAVIMCRYYPVDISWIGGLGKQSNIKLGMIEKAGAVDTISQVNALRSVDIGHVHIGQKYKSFMDMSPYSQLSLYLPWHGFIDLDMNLFNGHDVFVKALYDYLSGTIQYYVFYDNEVLVNTILCKMAMDIPITLQTKNDRDSAIFNNVSSTIGGLVGAGAGILSGNPIGMTLGITQGVGAFNSANVSAPMRLMGNVGESGAYIGCQNCFVVVRRPTIQASDGKKKDTEIDTSVDRLTTWKKNVGMLCGYGYKLSSLSGKGFTVCHSPRINFTNSAPLQSEVDEIYNYLEKGVIL